MFGRIPRRGYVRVGKIVTRLGEGYISLSLSLSLSLSFFVSARSVRGKRNRSGLELHAGCTPGEVIPPASVCTSRHTR